MHRANVFDLITNKPNQCQWVQEIPINALNECHRHINVKYNLNHDSTVQWQRQRVYLMHWHTFNIIIT